MRCPFCGGLVSSSHWQVEEFECPRCAGLVRVVGLEGKFSIVKAEG